MLQKIRVLNAVLWILFSGLSEQLAKITVDIKTKEGRSRSMPTNRKYSVQTMP